MAASLNKAAFYATVRSKPFAGSLSQGQVEGMNAILDACPPDLGTDSLAYCLATAFHETARTMLPIKEYGGHAYYMRMYDITGQRPAKARELGNTHKGDGAAFCGRGYVQLTGRSNYRRATGELQSRGYISREIDLTRMPDSAMVPDIAAAIMFLGMGEGWFTGRKLSHYFGPSSADPLNARRIINGLDKAETIKGYHIAFRAALKAAEHRPGAVTAAAPVPPVDAAPLPPLVVEPLPNQPVVVAPAANPTAAAIDAIHPDPPKPSAWARFWSALTGRAA